MSSATFLAPSLARLERPRLRARAGARCGRSALGAGRVAPTPSRGTPRSPRSPSSPLARAAPPAAEIAPAHLRSTITPVPPEAQSPDGGPGMDLRAQPGMAAGFGDLTAHDFLRVDVDAFPETLRVLSIDPPVVSVDAFLTDEQCDDLVRSAEGSGELKVSAVGGAAEDAGANIRTSRTCTLNSPILTNHPTKRAILDAAERLLPDLKGLGASKNAFKAPTGTSPFSYELPQVAHYRGGEYFRTHEDAFPPEVSAKKGYQRRATVLVYLNDVAEGGATRFDKLGFEVAPKKGRCLLFFPGTNEHMPDPRTLHTATEATPGHEKWISQLWVCGYAGKHTPAGQPPGPGDRKARRAKEKAAKKAAKKKKGNGDAGGGRRGGEA